MPSSTPSSDRFVPRPRRKACHPRHLSPIAGLITRLDRLSRLREKPFLPPEKMKSCVCAMPRDRCSSSKSRRTEMTGTLASLSTFLVFSYVRPPNCPLYFELLTVVVRPSQSADLPLTQPSERSHNSERRFRKSPPQRSRAWCSERWLLWQISRRVVAIRPRPNSRLMRCSQTA
jgi:hypothetical protein